MAEEEEPCVQVSSNGEVDNVKIKVENQGVELKRGLHYFVTDDAVLDLDNAPPPPCKKQVKEAPTEDICSEVTDSIVSPRENDNTSCLMEHVHGCENDKVELNNSYQSNFGEISYFSCGASIKVSDEDSRDGSNSSSSGVSSSHIALEKPKQASATGIRKITFKFRKSCDGQLPTSPARSVSDVYRNNESHDDFNEQPGLYGSSYPVSHNMELKMSKTKKVVSDGYPTNVKKLLSTGLLEGARVTYKTTSGDGQIPGIIKGSGYCCGCSSCNYTNVLSAFGFEQHAGGAKTRHPNNHIHLENGRPIYSIIEELKTAPPGILEEVVKQMVGPSLNEGSFGAWKAEGNQYDDMIGFKKCEESGPFLSQSHFRPPVKGIKSQGQKQQAYMKELAAESRNLTKRSDSSFSELNSSRKKSSYFGTRKRDNDSHRLLFLHGLQEGAALYYIAKSKSGSLQKILSGKRQEKGIYCNHCHEVVSPSQFEAHAGFGARRQPYRHIYTSEGITIHELAKKLSNEQDMCVVCGGGGDLMLCPDCPRAYHKGCVPSEIEMNENHDGLGPSDHKWHCPCCCRKADDNAKSRVVHCRNNITKCGNESGGCICVLCRAKDFSSNTFDDRTVIICDQCEKEYHVGCLREKRICDMKELPPGKWFCCQDCVNLHVALQQHVMKGASMLPFSVDPDIMRKGSGEITESDMQWQILCGNEHWPVHTQLLSQAVAIFQEGFNPIVSSSHHDLIPMMVYGENASGQDFAGIYTVILSVRSVVVSAGLLRVFGQEVAELPLVATAQENRRKGYFQVLLSCIERLLCSLNVRNLILPAATTTKSLWIKKFGFSEMKSKRMEYYANYYQLTGFKGASWLEKSLK